MFVDQLDVLRHLLGRHLVPQVIAQRIGGQAIVRTRIAVTTASLQELYEVCRGVGEPLEGLAAYLEFFQRER